MWTLWIMLGGSAISYYTGKVSKSNSIWVSSPPLQLHQQTDTLPAVLTCALKHHLLLGPLCPWFISPSSALCSPQLELRVPLIGQGYRILRGPNYESKLEHLLRPQWLGRKSHVENTPTFPLRCGQKYFQFWSSKVQDCVLCHWGRGGKFKRCVVQAGSWQWNQQSLAVWCCLR